MFEKYRLKNIVMVSFNQLRQMTKCLSKNDQNVLVKKSRARLPKGTSINFQGA